MSKRRDFLKNMMAIPILSSIPIWDGNDSFQSDIETLSHKFKISLNVYSFNQLLMDGKIDLFDVLDFCAKYNFDALDPTGYYFPGYPEVPSDEFINQFKRKAFLLGLDISGTGVRNDFSQPDLQKRKADIVMIKKWIEAAAKLGIPNLRVFAGTSPHEGFTRDQVFQWMADDLIECCRHGKEFGVIVSIQNHNDFLKTTNDVFRIFEMVDSEW
ncbi:MAG: sugar phosphate isomerase/epimerase, partial [Mariniphaga sp.]|nr:sugar phosphate isomerase/epimerase [Mariniphaga sp.]